MHVTEVYICMSMGECSHKRAVLTWETLPFSDSFTLLFNYVAFEKWLFVHIFERGKRFENSHCIYKIWISINFNFCHLATIENPSNKLGVNFDWLT